MAWAGATRQTAVTMSRCVRGIFFAKGGDGRRPDTQRVSGEGTLSWFWRCFRVVTYDCHAITVATQARSGLLNIAQEEEVELDAKA